MGTTKAAHDTRIWEMSEQESAELFDSICRREMGMSGEDFLSRWDTGVYQGVDVDSIDGATVKTCG